MKRTTAVMGEAVENIGYSLIGAAMLASAAMAFNGAPLALAARALPATGPVKVRLEGLVVTPSRTYSASEWANRPAFARRLATAQPRVCELPKAGRPATRSC